MIQIVSDDSVTLSLSLSQKECLSRLCENLVENCSVRTQDILAKEGFSKLTPGTESPLRCKSARLSFTSAASVKPTAAEAETISAAARALRQNLDEFLPFSGWATVLAKHGLVWAAKPHRASPGELNRRLRCWTEDSVESLDSSFFLSSGIWYSRHTPRLAVLCGAVFFTHACMLFERLSSGDFYILTLLAAFQQLIAGLATEAMAWSLFSGRRNLGKTFILVSRLHHSAEHAHDSCVLIFMILVSVLLTLTKVVQLFTCSCDFS